MGGDQSWLCRGRSDPTAEVGLGRWRAAYHAPSDRVEENAGFQPDPVGIVNVARG